MISKSYISALLLAAACLANDASAFAPASSSMRTATSLDAYVPAGLSAEQYQQIKTQDEQKKGKNLGALGPRGFKSRSMQAWQQAYEKGLATHSFAPFGYREQVKNGELKKSDVPYMVRGGSWDNSDVSGGKKLRWMKADKEYARGGYKKEQSASLLGSGPGLDWAGTRPRDVNLGNGRVPGFS
ncbi:MAG: hypothetical protein SGILL_005886 [Bacillariaceae sp.]